jgi:hypothetical protein
MSHMLIRYRSAWPWALLALILLAGLALGSCAPAPATATPTPTKTPRPVEAASAPTVAPTAPPPTANPTAAPATAAPVTVAPSASPSPRPTAGPSPTTIPPSPTTRPPAPTPVVSADALMTSPDFGIQAFLWWRAEIADRDLQLARDAGFHWVKQYFAWQDIEGAGKGRFDWSNADRVVEQAQKDGLKLIARVGADPDRQFWAGSPPGNAGDFAAFLSQMANRYRGRIQAYQIWNEPNLAREWGGKRPDPVGYARMLKTAYAAIKGIDPNAIIVTAGMAPTGTDNEIAMPDMKFYDQLYQAMGGVSKEYFDMLGVHAAGFAAPPEISPDEAAAKKIPYGGERFFAFRHVEDVRALMERYGDQGKRVVILEFGWTMDSRQGSDYYWHGAGAGIDQFVQGCYLVRALKYARENWRPWIALMSMIYLPDNNWKPTDEQFYWSIIEPGYPELRLKAPYVMVKNYLTKGIIEDRCK